MRTVVVANTKGGSGKTTVATHLAAAWASEGRVVALVDLDPQRSALGWTERRPVGLPRVRGHRSADGVEAEVAVWDLPAAVKRGLVEDAVAAADVVVVPVGPSAFDEDGTRRFLGRLEEHKAVRKGHLPVLLVANRVRSRTVAAARLAAFLSGLGYPWIGTVRDSAVYASLAVEGRSVFDATDRTARGLRADWRPVLAAAG